MRAKTAPTPKPLPEEIRDHLWLEEVRAGTIIRTIARRESKSVRFVQLAVTRARLRDLAKVRPIRIGERGEILREESPGRPPLPRLIPMFPIGPFTPSSTCGHRHPIRAGSVFCCMICHASGLDDHPELQRDPESEPSPEPAEESPIRSDTQQPPPNGCQTPSTVSRGRLSVVCIVI